MIAYCSNCDSLIDNSEESYRCCKCNDTPLCEKCTVFEGDGDYCDDCHYEIFTSHAEKLGDYREEQADKDRDNL